MNSLATFTVLTAVGVVLAQSGSSNPLIPSSISNSCSTFLSGLDANANITACLQPILNATSSFSPYPYYAGSNPSSVNATLQSLCNKTFDTACSQEAIRTQLTTFATSCSDELTGNNVNNDVIRMYDTLFAILPFRQAVCAQDDSGDYCLPNLSSSGSCSSSTPPSSTPSAKFRMAKRDDSTQVTQALEPDTKSIGSSNLMFLYINTNMTSTQLCTPCTRAVLTAYINFEQDTPYDLGISQSPMLGNQPDIYNYVTQTCGSNFMSGAVQAAGGLGKSLLSNGAVPSVAITNGVYTIAAAAVVGLAAIL